MTPACSGSVTTRSAASRTLPTMFSDDDDAVRLHLAHGVGDCAAHDGPGQDQHTRPRQPRDCAYRRGEILLADERDRVHRDALAADIVPIGLADRSDRHLTDLRAAPDDDHALPINCHQRLRLFDAPDDGK